MMNPHYERTTVANHPTAPGDQFVGIDRVSSAVHITPARVFTAVGGAIFLVMGLIAMAKGGLDGSVTEPVVNVAGMTHTPLLGILGAGAGLLLLIAAVLGTESSSRGTATFFGSLLAIAGLVAIATPESFPSLALESEYGWLMLIVGAVVVVANLLLPTITSRRVDYQ